MAEQSQLSFDEAYRLHIINLRKLKRTPKFKPYLCNHCGSTNSKKYKQMKNGKQYEYENWYIDKWTGHQGYVCSVCYALCRDRYAGKKKAEKVEKVDKTR